MERIAIITIALISSIVCHPHPYAPRGVKTRVGSGQISYGRNPDCFYPKPAKVFSWHLHVLFHHRNKTMTAEALNLYQEMADYLGLETNNSNCDINFNDKMCLFEPVTEIQPPFLTGQWGLYFFTEDLVKITNWITTHRGTLDTLIHPNSGCEIEDHSWWVIWSGQPWPLDFSIFKDTPWEKFNHHETNKKIELRSKHQILEDARTTDLVRQYLSDIEDKGNFIFYKN